jgi:hypothetical protein
MSLACAARGSGLANVLALRKGDCAQREADKQDSSEEQPDPSKRRAPAERPGLVSYSEAVRHPAGAVGCRTANRWSSNAAAAAQFRRRVSYFGSERMTGCAATRLVFALEGETAGNMGNTLPQSVHPQIAKQKPRRYVRAGALQGALKG